MAAEAALPDFIDINILPEQHRPRQLSRRVIILSLIAISLATLIFPLYLVSASIRGYIDSLETEYQSAQNALATVSTPAPEVLELMDTLSQAQETGGELDEAYSTITADRTDWPAVMAAIGNYDPDELALDSLTQADNRITLNGRAIDRSVVIAYADSLRLSDLFSSVEVQSISKVETPFVTATSTPEPTLAPEVTIVPTETIAPAETIAPTEPTTPISPTVAVTPAGPDEYEIDDFQAKDIILGQTQLHNFYPVHDVDKIKFLAKNGRLYRVFTSDLRPAVDTLLDVTVGGNRHINDDCNPGSGDLSSCLVFQVTTGYDVDAIVKISNRGQFGGEMWYQVTVEEIPATPTPIPTDTPVPPDTPVPTETFTPTVAPPPTETPVPTDTPVPPDTPTPTPDLRDVYEPNDTDPKPIAIGETQPGHNFFPDGDVDKVTFGVKEGRLYALTTSNLALGTDTQIVVTIDGEPCLTCVNDDIGPGFLDSEVRFVPTADGTAEATISVGSSGQYGDDKTYDLTLTLLSSLVDEYEPDDPFAKSITVDGVQEHNFYPDGDRDLVKFIAKGGQYYTVFTSNLGLGVDTHIKIVMDETFIGENDDISPGTVNFASAVSFQAPFDGTAVIIITNLQPQYGSDKTYEISVNKPPILHVSPLSRTFAGVLGDDRLPSPQEVYINSVGGGTLTWEAAKDEDAFWLNISPRSGAVPSVMIVSVDTYGLAVGTHVRNIYITATSLYAQNSPQTVRVTFSVSAPTPTPVPTATPVVFLLRPPGMASLGPGLAMAAPPYRLQDSEAVKFVIVLELKTGSP